MSRNLASSLLPSAGVDQHQPVGVLDQQAAHRERNPVPLVRLDPALPERLRHHAEHGAAVEPLEAALQRVAAEPADLKRAVQRHMQSSGQESARGSVGIARRPAARARGGRASMPRGPGACARPPPAPAPAGARAARRSPARRPPRGDGPGSRSRSKRVRLSSPQERTPFTSRRASRTVQSRVPSSVSVAGAPQLGAHEVPVEPGVVGHEDPPRQRRQQLVGQLGEPGRVAHHLVGDAGDGADAPAGSGARD